MSDPKPTPCPICGEDPGIHIGGIPFCLTCESQRPASVPQAKPVNQRMLDALKAAELIVSKCLAGWGDITTNDNGRFPRTITTRGTLQEIRAAIAEAERQQ